MTQSIGEKLRLAREARGIALRDISEQTRISMRYLEAIETDDYQRLPGGIFNRSFIRAYAKFVSYDEHEALEDYSRTLRERGETEEETSGKPRSQVYTDDATNQKRSPLVTLLLAIIILAALSLAVWAGLYFYQRSVGQRTGAAGRGQRVPRETFATPHARISNVVPNIALNETGFEEVTHGFSV
jgi:cytoskeletal protein RodZ